MLPTASSSTLEIGELNRGTLCKSAVRVCRPDTCRACSSAVIVDGRFPPREADSVLRPAWLQRRYCSQDMRRMRLGRQALGAHVLGTPRACGASPLVLRELPCGSIPSLFSVYVPVRARLSKIALVPPNHVARGRQTHAGVSSGRLCRTGRGQQKRHETPGSSSRPSSVQRDYSDAPIYLVCWHRFFCRLAHQWSRTRDRPTTSFRTVSCP